jgi:surfeit locus 1 family protein
MTLRLPAPVLLVLLVAVTALLVSLGVWQLQRNDWKNGLVEQRNARTDAAPLTFEAARALEPDNADYHRLADAGAWDDDSVFVIANRARFGTKGEELVVPLLLAPGGPAVLVNRGWYPDGKRAEAEEALDARRDGIAGLISVHTRTGQQTAAGTWTALDPVSMGATLPYDVLPWIVIEGGVTAANANPDSELPVQRFAAFANTTPHMEYGLTWFGLAVALISVAAIRFWPGRTQRDPPDPKTRPPVPEDEGGRV